MNAKFHPEARSELRRAATYFDEQRAGAGARLIHAIRETVQKAASSPHAGAPWFAVPVELEVRRRRVPGFKYMSIAYTVVDDTLWLIAVVHDRRRPGYWFHRLDDLPR